MPVEANLGGASLEIFSGGCQLKKTPCTKKRPKSFTTRLTAWLPWIQHHMAEDKCSYVWTDHEICFLSRLFQGYSLLHQYLFLVLQTCVNILFYKKNPWKKTTFLLYLMTGRLTRWSMTHLIRWRWRWFYIKSCTTFELWIQELARLYPHNHV